MGITQIEIKHIKGISNQCFKVQLIPYKPNLLVAPNGFGKSSIATAFSSMNVNRMDLADKDHHKENISLSPELSITVDGKKLTTTKNINEIRQQFDILVINSGLIPKATKGFKGSVLPSLEVKPIFICKIPPKAEITYKVSDLRAAFGSNGKILPNISVLLKSPYLIDAIEGLDLLKFTQKRIQTAWNTIAETINQQTGSTDELLQWIIHNCIADLRAISLLNDLSQRFVQLNLADSDVEAFLVAYQIVSLYSSDSNTFNAALEWLQYSAIKTHYDDLLSNFRSSSWQWASTEENNKKKILTITFPKAHQLSNGQRDIITLVIQLHKALYDKSKKPLILIIDEVFDYLDDANLVSFQYYITSIIEAYKKRNQIIYPVILTHLDPGVFFDFCFNKHKIQINYLLAHTNGKAKDTLKLIEVRDSQESLKDRLEKHWFHYHTENCVIPEDEWPKNLPKNWRTSDIFHKHTKDELTRYLEDKNYDPLAVCFAVRIAVEQLGYNLLVSQEQKDKFLHEEKKTKNKMAFVASSGVDIPESYFLLGLIYNTNLHWNQGRDYVSPLISKLNHPTIKQLIYSILNC